jgi:hypothetical protein
MAMRSDINPMGSTFGDEPRLDVPGTSGSRCNSTEWADDFLNVLNEREEEHHGRVAMNSVLQGMQNEPDFCAPPLQTPAGAKLFLLALAEAFFVKESGCRPEAMNPHAPNGTAVGFGQMGVGDARNHRCTTTDGNRITTNAQLQDPENNARCVAQIMVNCASGLPNRHGNMAEQRHLNRIAGGNRGQFGVVGCFWQPVRKGTGGDGQGGRVDNQSNREQIQEVTRNFCSHAGQGTNHLMSQNLVQEDVLCLAMNNGPCRSFQMASPFNNRRPSRGGRSAL